jgi:signal transduction histidine kinase
VLRGTSFQVPGQNGIQTGLNGSRVILVSKEIPLGEQTLTLVTERPASEAFALTVRTVLITVALVSAALAAAGFLGFMIVRQIVQPTVGLAATARALAAGDLTQRAQAGGDDELGVLADAFNTMADQLQKTIGSLEQRVAERTHALSRANEELETEVAERRRTEAELARSNAELQQFAYVASHDLQEPLRKIQAFGDLLAADDSEALSEQGRDYLGRMQDAARRMRALINDLLAFSRVTTRGQPFTPVDLTQVAHEVLSDLQVRIEQSGGRVELSDLPSIDADPMQMRQLLQNLIGNALKYRREDAVPLVHVYAPLVNGHEQALCQINVQDNGIGFDEKYLDRIFVPFQRLHGRNEYEGTGIGLAICSKIVQRHGGSITAKSTPGQGATFMVTLPTKQSRGEEM